MIELKNIDVKRKMIESCKDVNLPANIQGAGVINPVELLGVKWWLLYLLLYIYDD